MISGGELIRQCRSFRGYTQRHLAKIAGISYATISNVECGRHEPTYNTVMCCIEACGFTMLLAERSMK